MSPTLEGARVIGFLVGLDVSPILEGANVIDSLVGLGVATGFLLGLEEGACDGEVEMLGACVGSGVGSRVGALLRLGELVGFLLGKEDGI